MLTGSRFARTAYVMFAVAVLLALVKLSGLSGAQPLVLRMVPMSPVAKAAEPAAGESGGTEDEALDLPDADGPAPGPVGRLLTITSRVSNLPGREESARTREPSRNEAPVFYRPSSGEARGTDGGPVCGNLGDFPGSSRAVFPLPGKYFDSYEDTWGAARPQGGHEGTDLMSPTGTPEFAITDGTIVPVKGANENGWNTLGGYTVMLQAAYDVGPIRKGDLFYYAHMDEESTLKVGTKVRAGQRIGVAGDTGEGRETTRGKFPPHLHLGWYDAGSASSAGSRTDLESGAMNPYPLLLWLEAHGGAVAGGTDASYCEAPRESVPDSSGTSPDLDTGDHNDARPSPVVEARDGQDSPEREDRTAEKSHGPSEKSKEAGATVGNSNTSPAGSTEIDDDAGDERGESSAPDADRTTGSSTGTSIDAPTEDGIPQAKIRARIRTLLKDPSPPDPASRRAYVSALVDMLHEAEKKNEHDGHDADTPDKKKQTDKKKQKDQKNRPEPSGRNENRKGEPVTKTGSATARSQSVPDEKDTSEAPAPGKDPNEDSDTTVPEGRISPAKETPRKTRNGDK